MISLFPPAAKLPTHTHTEAVEELHVYVPRKVLLAWRAALAEECRLLRRPGLTPEMEQRLLNRYLVQSLKVVTDLSTATAAALKMPGTEIAPAPAVKGGAQ